MYRTPVRPSKKRDQRAITVDSAEEEEEEDAPYYDPRTSLEQFEEDDIGLEALSERVEKELAKEKERKWRYLANEDTPSPPSPPSSPYVPLYGGTKYKAKQPEQLGKTNNRNVAKGLTISDYRKMHRTPVRPRVPLRTDATPEKDKASPPRSQNARKEPEAPMGRSSEEVLVTSSPERTTQPYQAEVHPHGRWEDAPAKEAEAPQKVQGAVKRRQRRTMLEEGPPKDVSFAEGPRCCFGGRGADATLFCCRCAHKRRASPLTCLAICFLVLTYNLLGGFLFLAIEGSAATEETAVAASKPNLSQAHSGGMDLRSKTVERLWSITEDLNILYKENWTKLAAKELMDFQKVLIKTMRGGAALESRLSFDSEGNYRWTFSSSFLYALTLITTIGHGNVTPKSSVGKLVAVVYACVGIPIIMLYLSTIGEALARNFRVLYSKMCPTRLKGDSFHSKAECLRRYPLVGPESDEKRDKYSDENPRRTPFQAALNLDNFGGGYHWTCRDHTRVPILLSLLLIVLYIALGTFMFHTTEKWNFVDGCYFSFSSLATIGFGELRPGLHASTISAKAEDLAVGMCCIYILVGIVVIAMCFNLIQEDMSGVVRGFAAVCAARDWASPDYWQPRDGEDDGWRDVGPNQEITQLRTS
ncbi:hypothetical protein K1T71_011028 [Dendrolimus kikuchii]|uniref:Uncharacterized protein n=1 Tax=Dendrolimus kikuchii TaxID=765133 RepID=A0ACC1CMY6_9NEOP|nr:hypothetical protein K1T71_011028 [Dendrolimus kikuchii]